MIEPTPQPTRADDPSLLDTLHAAGEMFRHGLTEVVRQAGIRVPSLLAAFGREILQAHDSLLKSGGENDFAQASSLTASRMSLMADADLELDICIGDIGKRLREASGPGLWRCHARYMAALQQTEASEAGNPLGPETIGAGLWVIAKGLDSPDRETTLRVLARLEQDLCRELPELYRAIDQLLESRGVPSVPTSRNQARSKPAPTAVGNPLAVLQELLSLRAMAEMAFATSDNRAPVSDLSVSATRQALLDRLTARAAPAGAPTPASPGALGSQQLEISPGQPEALVVDTMALIFEGIFATDDLPEALKAIIGRLQIPVLKRALVDPALFQDAAHPVRRLLNRLARAAVGLPLQTSGDNPLCRQLGKLAIAVAPFVEKPEASLDRPLAELEALIAARDQAIRDAVAPWRRLVEGYENGRYAGRLARDWLDSRLARTRSPEIAAFLEKYWLPVVQAAATAGGTQGPRWQQDVGTADELIWSVEPKLTPEERKRLAGIASSLIKRLEAGLDQIGVTVQERHPFLNVLFDLQTTALRNPTAAGGDNAPRAAVAPRPAAAQTPNAPQLLEEDGRRVHYLGIPDGLPLPQPLRGAGWQLGDWLRFSVSDTRSLQGLSCWQSPLSGVVLFYNAGWPYAVALPPFVLDQQLRSARAQVLSHKAIFDAAVERALGLLAPR